MDTQTKQTTSPEKQASNVPEPPPLEIDIRTMESDIKAFQEGGGEVPTEGVQEAVPSHREGSSVQQVVTPAYTGPEKPLFETPAVTTPVAPQPSAPKQANMMLIIAGVVVGVIALGLLGYFVLFPILFKVLGS